MHKNRPSKKTATVLQNRLKEKLQKHRLSVHALEKSAGLKRSAVDNILRGKSKKPSAEILSAISRILGCSVDSLMGNTENTDFIAKTVPSHQSEIPFNSKMYAEAVSIASETLSSKKSDITESVALQFIHEIYTYSIQAGLDHIDKQFACWLAERWLKYTE